MEKRIGEMLDSLARVEGKVDKLKGMVEKIPDVSELKSLLEALLAEAPRAVGFPRPYQTLTVPAETTKKVYYFKIPKGYVGFIQRIANNYYPDTYLYWYIDGRLVITPYIEYQIAFVNNPLQLQPWRRVHGDVRWDVENRGVVDRDFEVLCDGIYCPEEEVALLLKSGLPIGR